MTHITFTLHEGQNKDGVLLGNVREATRKAAEKASNEGTENLNPIQRFFGHTKPVALSGTDRAGTKVEFAGYKWNRTNDDITIPYIVINDEVITPTNPKEKDKPIVVTFNKMGKDAGKPDAESTKLLADIADREVAAYKARQSASKSNTPLLDLSKLRGVSNPETPKLISQQADRASLGQRTNNAPEIPVIQVDQLAR